GVPARISQVTQRGCDPGGGVFVVTRFIGSLACLVGCLWRSGATPQAPGEKTPHRSREGKYCHLTRRALWGFDILQRWWELSISALSPRSNPVRNRALERNKAVRKPKFFFAGIRLKEIDGVTPRRAIHRRIHRTTEVRDSEDARRPVGETRSPVVRR